MNHKAVQERDRTLPRDSLEVDSKCNIIGDDKINF